MVLLHGGGGEGLLRLVDFTTSASSGGIGGGISCSPMGWWTGVRGMGGFILSSPMGWCSTNGWWTVLAGGGGGGGGVSCTGHGGGLGGLSSPNLSLVEDT